MVVPRVDQTYYELLGGEGGVRQLVDDFYDLMTLDERFAGIRVMHPQDMSMSRDKLFWFLSGWLGGPHYLLTARCSPPPAKLAPRP